jgi:hypothetical protein
VTIPQLVSRVLFLMMTFSLGRLTLRPSWSRPALMAMASSPATSVLFWMRTFVDDSGSQASVCEPELLVVTPSTMTFFDSVGWICQKREPLMVMPWISTFSQLWGSTVVERRLSPAAKMR